VELRNRLGYAVEVCPPAWPETRWVDAGGTLTLDDDDPDDVAVGQALLAQTDNWDLVVDPRADPRPARARRHVAGATTGPDGAGSR
jgi:hypothetical protein